MPPADSDLDDGIIHLGRAEREEGGGGQELEGGQFDSSPIHQRLEVVTGIHQLLFADRLAVDGDPFPKMSEMGTGIESDFHPAGLDQRCSHSTDAGFAVGAGNVNGPIVSVGTSEFLQTSRDGSEADGAIRRLAAEDTGGFEVAQKVRDLFVGREGYGPVRRILL